MGKDSDLLDKIVVFLQKRDGTDKLLKILRYSAKLLLATKSIRSPEAATRLKNFESSVGVSRKALRLGKFLQDVNELRKTPSLVTRDGILELIASGGEGVYYFIEQFIWLVKAGAIDKRHGPRLQKLSALFELIGYVGSVTLKAIQIAGLMQQEQLTTNSLNENQRRKSVDSGLPDDSSSASTSGNELVAVHGAAALRPIRFKRHLKTFSLIQDLSDSLLALADVLDEDHQPRFLKSASFLAAAGLFSATISAHKNWVSIS